MRYTGSAFLSYAGMFYHLNNNDITARSLNLLGEIEKMFKKISLKKSNACVN